MYFIHVDFICFTNFTLHWLVRICGRVAHKGQSISQYRCGKAKTVEYEYDGKSNSQVVFSLPFFCLMFPIRFFPSLSFLHLKHRATVNPENRCMKLQSTEKHFGYLFHFSSPFSLLWLGSNTISSKSLAFIFLLHCIKFVVFYSHILSKKRAKIRNTFDFSCRNFFDLALPFFFEIFFNLRDILAFKSWIKAYLGLYVRNHFHQQK